MKRGGIVDAAKYAAPFFSRYKKRILVGLVLGLISTLLLHSLPLILRYIIDFVIPAQDSSLLWLSLLGMLGVVIAGVMFLLMYIYNNLLIRESISLDVSAHIFSQLTYASPASMARYRTGDLLTTVNSDAGGLTGFGMRIIDDIPMNVVLLLYIFGILLFLDWRLLAISIGVIPFMVASQLHFGRVLRKKSDVLRTVVGDFMSYLEERIRNLKVIQVFTQEQAENYLFQQRGEEIKEKSLNIALTQEAALGISSFLTHTSVAAVLGVGAFMVMSDTLSLGSLFAFYGYQLALYSPVKKLLSTYVGLKQGTVSVSRVHSFSQRAQPLESLTPLKPLPDDVHELELKNVSVQIDDQVLLRSVTASFAPGQIIGLVGTSGAGKSTLLELLFRFMDPTQGEVLYGGENIRQYRVHDFRSQIAHIPAQPQLFSDTIENNIRFGVRSATRQDVIHAAKYAHIHEFIESLPQGYITALGDVQDELSMGQKQRIALARAVLKNPNIYLFDEATSGLDVATEQEVMRNWKVLRDHQRTVVVVTHRLSELVDADLIYVLDGGEIVEQGTYAELLQQDSLFRKLHGGVQQ